MSKISTYPILSTPTLNDLLIGTDVENLNETKNFSLSSIGNLIGQNYVPYVGATGNVDLGVYSIEGSAFIVNGGTASQFLKADGTLDSTFYVPQTRTITINSVGYDLSANRSWDLPTIDSLTTLGTSGAATYIGKVLNIPIYQAQGNYITQLSGEATGSGPGNATVTLSNSAVISKVLTGLNITGGNVIATDTILQAFGKVQNQINGLTGGVTYQGTWNASTNTPFLQSSVGTKGYYYVVSVPGTTNLNGITDWQLGDWAIYNGTAWEKVDNTDAVVSVNGYTGAVMLTYSDVGAPPATRTLTINGVGYDLSLDRSWTVGNVRTDQTYADPSWITSLGWSKIINTPTTLAGYGITDGVSTARTLTINGVGYNLTADRTWSVGTVTSVGTTAPLTGGTITGSGTIGITQASAISDGYLSSTDWSTFNSKQNAITASAPLSLVAGTLSITQAGVSSDGYLSSTDWNTFNSKVGGSGTANYLPIWTSSSVLGNSSLSFSLDTLTVGYNSITGGAVSFTNIGLTPYTYSIQMNNFGSPRSTFHNYTDGIIVQAIASTQVSRMFDNGNFILGTGTTDTGHKLTISGDLYVNTIANAIVDTDRFIVSDGGVIKYRTGAEILTDIGAVSSVGLTMPSAFTVSNSPITSSGTIAVTGAGTAAQYIRGDGTLGDFPGGGGGGGASVSYYLNGSINQGTFGGNTYYQMSKTPVIGTGTDFSISADGYIAQFITDVGVPDALLIPGGNWNFELYFSASSGGGSPSFYVELYKYDGTTFTLISSGSATPELIAFGTVINPYFVPLAVPETVLTLTDRIAIRVYVNHSGRTITLHTEDNHLCQIITTFTTGLTALNGLTKQVQYFAVGTSGSDFNISSSVATHTFNLPTASAVNRGALSSSDWSTFNGKQNALTLTTSGSSGPATLIGATLNIPDYGSALSGYVPYTGASQAVNLGIYSLSAGSLFVNGPAPTSGSYLGFKQATSVTTGGGGYTSISTFGTSQMNFSFAQPSGFKEFKFDVSSITTGVPGGRVYTMPDADGTIALVGGSGVGTVTSVAALTLGTSGTDLSSTVANSTTTPVITLNVPTASASNRGALSSADWSTFNAKQDALTLTTTGTSGAATLIGATLNIPQYQAAGTYVTSVTASSPLASSGGTTPNITIQQATATQNGFLSSTDWSTFNNKQNTITLTTTGTSGAATLVGSTLNIPQYQSVLTNPITGTGTTNYLPKFTGTSSIGNSIVQDAGIRVDIGGDIRLTPSSAVNIQAYTGSVYTNLFYNAASHNWQNSGGATKMFLNSNDNLLIGTTTDGGQKLQVTGTFALRASASISSATQIPIFNADPSGTTRELVTRTPAQLLSDIGGQAALTNPVTGTGTTNYLAKFTGSTTVGNSQVFDNGTNVGIGTTSVSGTYEKLAVAGGISIKDNTNAKLEIGRYNTTGAQNSYIKLGANSNSLRFTNNTDIADIMELTNSGNLGLGVTPSAWGLGKAIEFGNIGNAVWGVNTTQFNIIQNAYFDSGYKYASSNPASYYQQVSGSHVWYNAPSGTAGNAISFTHAMTLTSSGNLLVGTTSDNGARLQVSGAATFSSNVAAGSTSSGAQINVFASSYGNNGLFNAYGTDNLIKLQMGALGTNEGFIFTGSGNKISFFSGGNLALTLNSNQTATFSSKVGVGGAAATYSLTAYNASNGTTAAFGGTARGIRIDNDGTFSSGRSTIFGVDSSFYGSYQPLSIEASSIALQAVTGGNVLIGTTTDVGSKLRVNGVGYFDDSIFSGFQGLNVGGYNFYSQTISGAMGILGHNLRASSSVANQVNVVNSGWYSSMIRMYYSEGIAFHTSLTSYNAGDVYPMAATERMRITSGGNVGIGVDNPQTQLHINGVLTFSEVGFNTVRLNQILSTHSAGSSPNNSLRFLVSDGSGNTAERMRVNGSGNVLIGTTTDNGQRLQVSGGYITQSGGGVDTYLGYDGTGSLIGTTTNHYFRFITNNTERMRITSGGNVGIGTSSPSVHSGANALVVFGNSATGSGRAIIELHEASGSGGKAVFQQVVGTTYIGNLAKGGGSGDLILLSNGTGTSATESMVIKSNGNILIGTTTDVGARLYVDGAFRTGTLTAGTQTTAVDWRLGNARGGTATANALVRVQINGVLVDLIGNYV